MIKQGEIYTKFELARELKCHFNSISNWEKQGLIVAHRMNRRIYFYGAEVLEALGIEEPSEV